MTRRLSRLRRSAAAELIILSAPSAAAGARATGLTRSRASQIRTAAGIAGVIGRPRGPTSLRSLQELGARVVADSAAVELSTGEYLDRAHALIDRLLRGEPPLPGEEAERASYSALIALIRESSSRVRS